jgi:hypothetical protein
MFQKHTVDYPDDCKRIQCVANELKFDFSLRDAEDFWEWFSDEYYCAGWMILPEKDAELRQLLEENYNS